MKIYKCNVCGNIFMVLKDSEVTPMCCNQDMEALVIKTNEELFEKHLPTIFRNNDKVKVEVNHVSEDKHYIEFIVLETDKGCYIKHLGPNVKPCVTYKICEDEKILNAYEYCNIHGLFKKEYVHEEDEGC